jgi:hypothetical protein
MKPLFNYFESDDQLSTLIARAGVELPQDGRGWHFVKGLMELPKQFKLDERGLLIRGKNESASNEIEGDSEMLNPDD